MNESAKSMRRQIQDIVIYSKGSFTIKELYQLPYYQILEILDAFNEKSKREKDAVDAAQGKNKRSF